MLKGHDILFNISVPNQHKREVTVAYKRPVEDGATKPNVHISYWHLHNDVKGS